MRSGRLETCLVHPSTVAAKYETLRMAALGEALPPDARSGLMLFLCRGMWGWARTLATQSFCEDATPAPSLTPTSPCEREAAIRLLAAMAIDSLTGGYDERVP
jgi:hypothetical protein